MSNIPTYHKYEAFNFLNVLRPITITSQVINPASSIFLEVKINDGYQFINNIPVDQGDLIVIAKEAQIDSLFELDDYGNLLLLLSDEHALTQSYEVDDEGHLILTHSI